MVHIFYSELPPPLCILINAHLIETLPLKQHVSIEQFSTFLIIDKSRGVLTYALLFPMSFETYLVCFYLFLLKLTYL